MSVEENKVLLRHVIEEINAGNRAAVWNLMPDDVEIVDHTGAPKTKAEFKHDMDAFYQGHPDFRVQIEDLIGEGDEVVVRYTESGTWTQDYLGMEPTGRKMSYPAIEIWRIEDGRVTGMWMARDILTAGTQSGLIPEMG